MDEIERFFWLRVREVRGGCWEWLGALDKDGYGKFRFRGWSARAHRVAYELFVGEPKSMSLDHLCHNEDKTCAGGKGCLHRRCVNPGHLELVLPKENKRRALGLSLSDARSKNILALRQPGPPPTKTPASCVVCGMAIPSNRHGWNTCSLAHSRTRKRKQR